MLYIYARYTALLCVACISCQSCPLSSKTSAGLHLSPIARRQTLTFHPAKFESTLVRRPAQVEDQDAKSYRPLWRDYIKAFKQLLQEADDDPQAPAATRLVRSVCHALRRMVTQRDKTVVVRSRLGSSTLPLPMVALCFTHCAPSDQALTAKDMWYERMLVPSAPCAATAACGQPALWI